MKEYQKWAIPNNDLLVRYPQTKYPLPAGGAYVPWTGPEGRYWRRREKVGDIVIVSPPKIENKSKKLKKS